LEKSRMEMMVKLFCKVIVVAVVLTAATTTDRTARTAQTTQRYLWWLVEVIPELIIIQSYTILIMRGMEKGCTLPRDLYRIEITKVMPRRTTTQNMWSMPGFGKKNLSIGHYNISTNEIVEVTIMIVRCVLVLGTIPTSMVTCSCLDDDSYRGLSTTHRFARLCPSVVWLFDHVPDGSMEIPRSIDRGSKIIIVGVFISVNDLVTCNDCWLIAG
jgi:hypothetical protein